jgi:hypothetical protein
MSLPLTLLAAALSTIAIALLLLALAKPILQTRLRYSQAAASALLMALLGTLAAASAGAAYATIRPFLASLFLSKFKLMGWWIDLDIAIVWTCGLAAGYTAALCLTLKARNSRRLASAMLAAAATPFLLSGAELLITRGIGILPAVARASAPGP